jgi:hypothetical protein
VSLPLIDNSLFSPAAVQFPHSGPRETIPYILSHHIPRGLPQSEITFPALQPPTNRDFHLAERLLAAYQKALDDQGKIMNCPNQDLWEMMQNEFHQEFFALLRSGDAKRLAETLTRAFYDPITHGLGPGTVLSEVARSREGGPSIAALTIDRLIALAEALGLLPYENPEQGRWGENIYLDPTEVAKRIQDYLGIEVCPPLACGYFGVPIGKSVLFMKSSEHLYTAWRLTNLCSEHGNSSVCEIGGGYGGVAYYAYRLGVRKYSIFDLPQINVLQGYYLGMTLPDAPLVLYGEPHTSQGTAQGIHVMPYWQLKREPNHSFAVALNQDSFPEIEPGAVKDYLGEIRRLVKGVFLSINQEAQAACQLDIFQNHVPTLVAQAGGFRRLGRFPYWMRRGYVEEMYVACGTVERVTGVLSRIVDRMRSS